MKQRAAALVAADPDSFRFWVLRRRSTGLWELPGGRIEPGETRRAAAARESAEELGCTVRVHGRRFAKLDVCRRSGSVTYSFFTADVSSGVPHAAERAFTAAAPACWAELAAMPLSPSLGALLDAVTVQECAVSRTGVPT